MINMKAVRQDSTRFRKSLESRGMDLAVFDKLIYADLKWRDRLIEIDQLKSKRNSLTPKGQPTEKQRNELKELSLLIKEKQENVTNLEIEVKKLAAIVPNLPHSDCPVGASEDDNVLIRTVGSPKEFDFSVKSHEEIGVSCGILNFEQATQVTGSRFVVYHNDGALLERSLINFMLDTHCNEHGYNEVLPPVIVNSNSVYGTGQLPKFSDDLFKLDDTDYWLSPTAEVQLTNLYRDTIVPEKELPIKMAAYTPCFRKEAGSYGKDTQGLIRHHQFNKVELVKLVHPKNTMDELHSLLNNAEAILKLLDLPYRVVELCTGDLGFSAEKTYDIEVWFPSQNCYREISSCSSFLDFQSRRAMIRYKDKQTGSVSLLNTINGSGLAVGRTMAAILENFQQEDGSVIVPDVLRKYTQKKELWQITKNI